MEFEWDAAKRITNQQKHGVDFADAKYFKWDVARIVPDTRKNYGEQRFVAIGPIGERLHVIVYTHRSRKIRIIGLRKANPREIGHYEYERETRLH